MVAQDEGRDTAPAAVDQPKPTKGGWVRDGGVVLEAAFAEALGLRAGDPITLEAAGRSGSPASRSPPPRRRIRTCPASPSAAADRPGLVTRADARRLAPPGGRLSTSSNLKLADPAAAPAFAAERNRPRAPARLALPPAGPPQLLRLAGRPRGERPTWSRNQRRVLLTGGWLLALLAVASVAVLVGGRMADQIRRVGLLKAVGGTPSLVAAVLLAEYVAVALLAAAAGLAVGWLAAPLLTEASAGLLGSAGAPPLTLSTIGLVTAVALAVAVAATFVPAVRAARTSTVLALADAARAAAAHALADRDLGAAAGAAAARAARGRPAAAPRGARHRQHRDHGQRDRRRAGRPRRPRSTVSARPSLGPTG